MNSNTALIAVRYDEQDDALELVFRSGKVAVLPRVCVHELAGADVLTLRQISVSPAGDAIVCRALDVDLDIRGLLNRAVNR